MATRKKAKTKRKKTAAKRSAIRKKPVRVVKKQAARKPARKPAVARARPKAAKPPSPPLPPPAPGERIGIVTHYYGNVSVAVIKLESASLRVGDTIHIRGHTSDFAQRVESLQIGHAPVSEVGPNDDFGLKVVAHVREHDIVYKVK
jgi:hypothetical protein